MADILDYWDYTPNRNFPLTAVHPSLSAPYSAVGQSFITPASPQYKLYSAMFYVKIVGSPTGIIKAYLYNSTGAVGSEKPTGNPLAISDGIVIENLTTSYQLIEFLFTGAEQITLNVSTNYCIDVVVESGVVDSTNYIHVGRYDGDDGNGNYFSSNSWSSTSNDICFYVYGILPAVDHFITLTEVLGMVESKSRIRNVYRTFSDKLAFKESKTRIRSIFREFSETLACTDTLEKIATFIEKVKAGISKIVRPYDFYFEEKIRRRIIGTITFNFYSEQRQRIIAFITSKFEETPRKIFSSIYVSFQEAFPIGSKILQEFTESTPIMGKIFKKFEETIGLKSDIGIGGFEQKLKVKGKIKTFLQSMLEKLREQDELDELEKTLDE